MSALCGDHPPSKSGSDIMVPESCVLAAHASDPKVQNLMSVLYTASRALKESPRASHLFPPPDLKRHADGHFVHLALHNPPAERNIKKVPHSTIFEQQFVISLAYALQNTMTISSCTSTYRPTAQTPRKF